MRVVFNNRRSEMSMCPIIGTDTPNPEKHDIFHSICARTLIGCYCDLGRGKGYGHLY